MTASPASPTPAVLLAGATGLVGRALLTELTGAPNAAPVQALVRRVPDDAARFAGVGDRLHWLVVDYAALPALPPARSAYCALGTTIRAAGSQAAFRAVDHDAVLAFARAARAAGARRLAVVSALGADAASAVFYNRVKGEVEDALRGLGFERLVIARPSLLVGDRRALGQPPRSGERLAIAVTAPLAGLIPKAWRPIGAPVVAKAMRVALAQPGPAVEVLESGQLQELGR